MSLRHSYGLLAPIYDLIVDRPLQSVRRRSLDRLPDHGTAHILIDGIGTGLDIPHLPVTHRYTGTDITPAMLRIAERRMTDFPADIELLQADSMCLPFDDNSFDHVVMHLIMAVVPNPSLALAEAHRVIKPGGHIYILDKFLKPGELAPVRRLMNTLTRHIATRTDVVFEDALSEVEGLTVVSDEPALAGGWFRLIECKKQ